MALTSNWVSVNLQTGYGPPPGNVWTTDGVTLTGTTIGIGGIAAPNFGTIAQFRDIGSTSLGTGEFIWLQGVASTAAGDVVTYSLSNGTLQGITTRWTGTANTGFPLAVATAATVANSAGWYQIGGAAVVNSSGTVTAGDKAYYAGATATLGSTGSNGAQVLGAQATGTSGTWLAAGQAVYTLDRPHVQSQTS